jgi:quinol monooxygenase YgiN
MYEVSFQVPREKMTELEIGQSLERLVGYMKIRLPAQRGFVLADAVYSVDDPESLRIVMRSQWSDWTDLQNHCNSSALVEDQAFEQFAPHICADDITIRKYAEVGSGPLSARK